METRADPCRSHTLQSVIRNDLHSAADMSKFSPTAERSALNPRADLPAEKKSLAFTLVLLSREKNLTGEEIESDVQQIVRNVQQDFNATLRSS